MKATIPLSFLFAATLGTGGCSGMQHSSEPAGGPSPAPSATRVPYGDFLAPELVACCEGDGSSSACDRVAFKALNVVCLGDDRIASKEQPRTTSVVDPVKR